MQLIVYYVIFMIAGDLAAYFIRLVTEREFGSEASLIVFLTLYFLFLWVSWVLAVRVTKPKQTESAGKTGITDVRVDFGSTAGLVVSDRGRIGGGSVAPCSSLRRRYQVRSQPHPQARFLCRRTDGPVRARRSGKRTGVSHRNSDAHGTGLHAHGPGRHPHMPRGGHSGHHHWCPARGG